MLWRAKSVIKGGFVEGYGMWRREFGIGVRGLSEMDAFDPGRSRSRTGITSELWEIRRKMNNTRKGATRPQEATIGKPPKSSMLSIDLPLRSDPYLHHDYVNWRGTVRMGRLLEDLDSFAGNIAFLHADDGDPDTIPLKLVTAAIDRIDMRCCIPAGVDLRLEGNVTHTGRSSMRVSVSLARVESGRALTWRPQEDSVLTANFVFVAVGADGRAAAVNPLIPESEEERTVFEAGEKEMKRRKSDRLQSLDYAPPTEEESRLLHEELRQSCGWGGEDMVKDGEAVELGSTELRNVVLMQPQERNTAGNVFGGFLVRQAYELAHATASVYASRSNVDAVPELVACDEITFAKPVKIGSLVNFHATVVYAAGATPDSPTDLCHVRAEAVVLDLNSGDGITRTSTNVFHFTFRCHHSHTRSAAIRRAAAADAAAGFIPKPVSDVDFDATDINSVALKPIRPQTYAQAMLWLDGRRRLRTAVHVGKQMKSKILP